MAAGLEIYTDVGIAGATSDKIMPTPRPLILASSSIYRRQLLQRLIRDFESVAPAVDEQSYHTQAENPDHLADLLAVAKARAVQTKFPHATIVASDQLVDSEGEVLGKPGSESAAEQQLMQLAGRTHRLITAVCICDEHTETRFAVVTRLSVRPLKIEEVRRYVARDRPLDCAGSYRIEEAGISLFDRIECEDFTAIVGLPLLQLSKELRQRGYEMP